jgi:hypothetical protein
VPFHNAALATRCGVAVCMHTPEVASILSIPNGHVRHVRKHYVQFGTCSSKCEMSCECQAAFKSRIIFPDVVLEGGAGLYLFIAPDTLA